MFVFFRSALAEERVELGVGDLVIFVTDIDRDLRDADWLDHLARMTTRRIDLRRREMFQRDENDQHCLREYSIGTLRRLSLREHSPRRVTSVSFS